ncbi:MAG: RadC family protein [Clostridiales bacterium]|nr:RadC family protein [Clostridiales bacterium]
MKTTISPEIEENTTESTPQKAKPAKADGHRERMRERAINEGLEGFEDHRLLEMLLYYSIPRKDTREEAVRLIDRFGSFEDVFEADMRDLNSVDGIGKASVIQLMVVKEIIRRCSLQNQKQRKIYKTIESIIEMFKGKFIHTSKELMYIASFDNARHLIRTDKIGLGSVNDISVSMREINEIIVMNHAAYIAVAHNHPNGYLLPSNEDIDFTLKLQKFASDINVKLIEHIIFVDDESYLILRNHNLE